MDTDYLYYRHITQEEHMTVETTTRKQTFSGGTGTFTFTFRTLVDHPDYILVKKTLISTGVETDLTYGVDYSVSVESDGIGGTVTASPTISTLYTVTVYRETSNVQQSDYDDYNQFPADTLEDDLDRRTMIAQEQSEETGRTLKLPITSSLSDVEIPNPEADKFLGWNAAADEIENKSIADLGAVEIDTSTSLGTSDTKVPSQNAVKTYVDAADTLLKISLVNFIIDGGVEAISTGIAGDIGPFPFACTLNEVTLLANTTGSIVIDFWKDLYANYPPTVADTMVGASGTKATIAADVKSVNTLTGWAATAIPSASTIRFNVDSCSGINRVTVALKITRS